MAVATDGHRWKFFRAGGVDQVVFRSGADIVNLDRLDQKLWTALACPTRGIEFDPKTLDLLDMDKDGRIRAGEVLAAVKWVGEAWKNPDDLLKGGDSLALAAIHDGTATGRALLAGAKRILDVLGRPQATSIALADVASTEKIFAATRLNGDGVVTPDTAEDDATRKAFEDLMAVQGTMVDRSGKPGIDRAKLDAFFADAAAFSDWSAKAEADGKSILPLGEGTAPAARAVATVKAKVDDYFTRCRLAAFDARAAAPLNRAESEFAAIATKDLRSDAEEIAKLPLARVEAGRALPLGDGVNPAWAGGLAELAKAAVAPLLGAGPAKSGLSEADWSALQGKLAAHGAWAAAKPAAAVEKLGLPRLRALLKGDAKAKIGDLMTRDAALEPEFAQVAAVEKLLRFQRDLVKLLNNFVNFSDFYSRRGAVFQAGTLYLDGRSLHLCVRVDDAGKHAALAGLAKTYLAYCDCARPAQGEKMTIAAAITNGDSDHLMVGRNGIFYDRKGKDWDATIAKIVENPISVREAFWGPYKRFVRMIEEQVAKRAAAADTAGGEKLSAAATAAAQADKTKAGEKQPSKIDIGTVAAIGVAVGGIATFFSSILATFFGLGSWMPVGFLVLLLAISGPSMIIAWLKLRQRNLGPILDANGWAVNGRVKVNVPFGAALTDVAALPKGSERALADPYAEKGRPWKLYFVIVVILLLGRLWYSGKLDGILPKAVKSTEVLGEHAPAYKAKAQPAPAEAPK